MAGTFSRVKTWVAETLTASDLNAEFDNILNNLDPDGIDDACANAAAMQTVADPYSGAVVSLATSLRGDIQRLRYLIAQITGETYWYIDPDSSLATLVSRFAYGTIWIPAGAMIPKITNGAEYGIAEKVTNDVMYEYYAFDSTTEEYVSFALPMPMDYNAGTVKAKFYWSSAAGSTVTTDTVEWEISGKAFLDSAVLDQASGTSQVITDTLLASDGTDLQLTSATPAITIADAAAQKYTIFTVSRNVGGTDNMTEDAWLFGVFIQYGRTNAAVTAW